MKLFVNSLILSLLLMSCAKKEIIVKRNKIEVIELESKEINLDFAIPQFEEGEALLVNNPKMKGLFMSNENIEILLKLLSDYGFAYNKQSLICNTQKEYNEKSIKIINNEKV